MIWPFSRFVTKSLFDLAREDLRIEFRISLVSLQRQIDELKDRNILLNPKDVVLAKRKPGRPKKK